MPRPTTSGWRRNRAADRVVAVWSTGLRERDRVLHDLAWRRALVARGHIGRDLAAATAALGHDHLLVRALKAQAAVCRQLLVTSAALAGSLLGLAAGTSWAPVALKATAAVGLVIGTTLVVLGSRARSLARGAIIDGQSELPLRLLARERQRLRNPRKQASLARALENLVRAAATWPRIQRAARPVFDVRIVRAATPELEALAQLLRARPPSARAVALVERLLTSGDSPLYGREPDQLRHELALIRHELIRGSVN